LRPHRATKTVLHLFHQTNSLIYTRFRDVVSPIFTTCGELKKTDVHPRNILTANECWSRSTKLQNFYGINRCIRIMRCTSAPMSTLISSGRVGSATTYHKPTRCPRALQMKLPYKHVLHTKANRVVTYSSLGLWSSLVSKARSSIPEEAVLRNEDVHTASEAVCVGVRLYNENRRTVAVQYLGALCQGELRGILQPSVLPRLQRQPGPSRTCLARCRNIDLIMISKTCSWKGFLDIKGGLRLGLDWDRCVTTAPTAELVELQASTQVRRRMMRCAQHFKAR